LSAPSQLSDEHLRQLADALAAYVRRLTVAGLHPHAAAETRDLEPKMRRALQFVRAFRKQSRKQP
jgi:hypothetical protein